jgi:hypothetical protein
MELKELERIILLLVALNPVVDVEEQDVAFFLGDRKIVAQQTF